MPIADEIIDARITALEAQLAETRKALDLIAEGRPDNPIGDPWAFYDDLVTVARRALEAQGGE